MGLVEIAAAPAAAAAAAPRAASSVSRAAAPDVFIGIDSPEFNLRCRARCARAAFPTVQYVSPQVWAWRQGRVRTIAAAVDLVLCLLPFEAKFYDGARRAGRVRRSSARRPDSARSPTRLPRARRSGLPRGGRVVAVLPGSRGCGARAAGRRRLPRTHRAGSRRDGPTCAFVAPMANPAARTAFVQALARARSRRRGARSSTGRAQQARGGERRRAGRLRDRDARDAAREAADGGRLSGRAAHRLAAARA